MSLVSDSSSLSSSTLQDHFLLTTSPLESFNILTLVSSPFAGAISTFIGTTRNSFNGLEVLELSYEAYDSMTLKIFKQIAEECRKKWQIIHLAFYHRIGVVPVTCASVYLAVSSVHRMDSLLAVQWAIDQIKAKAPIWKKEIYSDGSMWKQNQEWNKEILMKEQENRENEDSAHHCKACNK
jgi:molybdopterin synthase catalytic subunit